MKDDSYEFNFFAVPSNEPFIMPLNWKEEHEEEMKENNKNFYKKMKEIEQQKVLKKELKK